ncbi:MAG: hypothetical protein IJN10_08595 [Firmicutes bacterium]|nr:hypothetical protein [Bacillota bacterium]
MLKVKKWFVVLICMLLTVGGGSLQLLAEEEGPEAGQTEVGNIQQLKEEAQPKTVPAGYADMRVGKMMDDGFIRSNGIYAEYYYSAQWAGQEISSADTVLKPGQITYCIDPDTPLIGESGDEAYGWIGDKDVIRNLTTERITAKGVIFRMLGRILQVCGTDLTDGAELAANAAEGTKYVATQMIIWQLIWGDMDAEFNLMGNTWEKYGWQGMKYYQTAPAGGKSVKEWYELWIAELKNSKKIPDFAAASSEAAPTYEMKEDSMTLVDNRNTLQYMRIQPSDPAVTVAVSGNQLVIQNPQRVDCTVTIINTVCEGSKEPTPILAGRVSDGQPRQTTILASNTELADPVQGFFNIKAAPSTADLQIQKTVEQDEYLHASLKGYQFRVQSTQTGYNELHETDAEGKIYIRDLKIGTYTIEEVLKEGTNVNGGNFQFVIPAAVTVEIGANGEEVTQVNIQNDLRRGTVKIQKVDAMQPSVKLFGAQLLLEKKVYTLPGENPSPDSQQDERGFYEWKVVEEKITNEEGEAGWTDLTVGEYRLTETKAAEGYQLLAECVYFSMPDGDSWSCEGADTSINREFVLQNLQAYAMPDSGGGRLWMYIIAFALGAGGVGIRYVKKGRKQNEA